MQQAFGDNKWTLLEDLAKRIPRIMAAWVVGCVVCLANSTYDGSLALIILPFFTAFNAAVAVILSLILGAIFLNRSVRRFWKATYIPAVVLFVVAGFLLSVGLDLGLREEWIDPDSGQRTGVRHSSVLFGGLLAMVFAVVHWPARADQASRNFIDLIVMSSTDSGPVSH